MLLRVCLPSVRFPHGAATACLAPTFVPAIVRPSRTTLAHKESTMRFLALSLLFLLFAANAEDTAPAPETPTEPATPATAPAVP